MRGSETITGSALPAIPSLPEETVDYAYNAVNQLLSVTNPNLTFVYDDDGNMVQGYVNPLLGGAGVGFPFTATYDAEDRMTSLEYTDSSNVVHRTEYRYSGDGFLAEIRKYENSVLVDTVRIVRDGFLAVQDRDGNNNVVREYTWGLNLGGGIGGLLNLKQGGQDYAYLYDGKGNVAAVIDSSQAVVAAYRYAPFGKLLAKTGSLTQPFGFSTKRYDEQTGLIHYQYRPYAPEIGRWLTRDPLGEEGGMNLYAFVGNNPVNWVDPWGLMTGELILKPIIEFIKIELPSLGLGSVASGVVGGIGGVLGNMIFATNAGVGSDVIPLPNVACKSDDFTTYENERHKLAQNKKLQKLLKGKWEPPEIGPVTSSACAAACLACSKGKLAAITCPFCAACLLAPNFTAPSSGGSN